MTWPWFGVGVQKFCCEACHAKSGTPYLSFFRSHPSPSATLLSTFKPPRCSLWGIIHGVQIWLSNSYATLMGYPFLSARSLDWQNYLLIGHSVPFSMVLCLRRSQKEVTWVARWISRRLSHPSQLVTQSGGAWHLQSLRAAGTLRLRCAFLKRRKIVLCHPKTWNFHTAHPRDWNGPEPRRVADRRWACRWGSYASRRRPWCLSHPYQRADCFANRRHY